MMTATCLMVNCRNKAPDTEAFCAKHRDKPTQPAMAEINLGPILIRTWPHDAGKVWLELTEGESAGEGGTFGAKELAAHVLAFYRELF